jgi:Galactose oxidase, central domain
MMRLRWGAFFLVLLFLVIQVIPRALGQRDASKRPSDVEIPLLKQQSAPSAPLEPAVCSSWTSTGSLNTARDSHTATLLPNGIVLVAGGFGVSGGILASAELYDPASETWTVTDSLNTARAEHTATLLSNGMVLVAGDSALAAFSLARNCTTRQAGLGLPRVASTPRDDSTRRRCYQMGWC